MQVSCHHLALPFSRITIRFNYQKKKKLDDITNGTFFFVKKTVFAYSLQRFN